MAADTHESSTLRINLASEIDTTDPTLVQHVVSGQLTYATQAKLLNYPDESGPGGLEPVPEVAEDLPEISDEGRTYTFRIRSGNDAYRLSTGEVVTAEHFAHAIARALDPKMSSPATIYASDIVGARDVIEGGDQAPVGVRVLSGNRLEVRLNDAAPDFLHRIAMPYFSAVPLDMPHDPSGVLAPSSAGPYFVSERRAKERIVLERNPYYAHGRPQGVEAMVYTVGIDPDSGLRGIERGDADYVADGLPATMEAELGAKYGVNSPQFMVSPSLQNDYLALNTSRPLFADPRVRRAVSFVIDRPSILRSRGAYAGIVATHLLPPGMPGYRDEHCYPSTGPDLDRAREELPPDFSGAKAIVYTWDTLAGPTIGRIIARNLKEIGIEAEVVEWPEPEMHLRAATRGEEFDLVASGWTADYPDPYAFLNVLLDGTTIRDQYNANQCYFNEPAYNAKLQAAARRLAPERYPEYGDLDLEIMQVAAPLVATDYRTKRDFVSKRVQGAFQHSLYGVDLCALWTGS